MVAVSDVVAFIKITGRANFTTSIPFKCVVNELLARGQRQFILDLTDCVIMDSTFLGALAKLNMQIRDRAPVSPGSRMVLLNPSPKIAELLDNLGVLEMFSIRHGKVECPAEYVAAQTGEGEPSKTELSLNCLEAHRTLMAINPQNISKFKDVTRFLEEDLSQRGVNPAVQKLAS